jgi:hypothetical protein
MATTQVTTEWPKGFDQNDIEHIEGRHVQAPRRSCGHCAWYYAAAPVVTRRVTKSHTIVEVTR